MTRHYRGLKFIGLFLKIAGGIEAAIGTIALIFVPLVLGNADSALAQLGLPLTQDGAGLWAGIVLGVALMFIGVVTGLLTFALGELINVVIAIEENTRTKPLANKTNQITSA
jgi:sugar (pentulose or hexulose) kinase